MASITKYLAIIVMAVSVVCQALVSFGHSDDLYEPFDDKYLVNLVKGRTFRSSQEWSYDKEVILRFDAFGEKMQISMEMSSKAQNPGKQYLSPWVHVKFHPSAVGQIGLKADSADKSAFRQFEQGVSMETGGAAGVFKCLVTYDYDPKFTIHVCAGGTTGKYCQSVLLK